MMMNKKLDLPKNLLKGSNLNIFMILTHNSLAYSDLDSQMFQTVRSYFYKHPVGKSEFKEQT